VKQIQRALISVYDKTGVVEFARGLAALNVDIISTGATARLLRSHGVAARDVSDVTNFPEILDGRVKTISPRIAGGVLAIRANEAHIRQVQEHHIPLIDLVCVNLYPFIETTRKPGVAFEEVIENIDIGGPSLIRAAAKNFQDVAVLTSPADYEPVLEVLRTGNGVLPPQVLFDLCCKAFSHVARYDGQIAGYLSQVTASDKGFNLPSEKNFPRRIFVDFEKIADLRYGENPHQRASFYRWGNQPSHGFAAARQWQGKELSYNNFVDLDAAWNLIREFSEPACCIIKHTNPCGTAIGTSLFEAYTKAYQADIVSAFGSIVAVNRVLDEKTAHEMGKLYVEAIIAPGYEQVAIEELRLKKNLRLLSTDAVDEEPDGAGFEIRLIAGGLLLQDQDKKLFGSEWRIVTDRKPSAQERADLEFAWRVCKHVKSNAIVLAEGGRTVGIGAGQMSRVDSVRLSIQKAHPSAKGSTLASDAFFPFRDNVDEAAQAGIAAIIQPGGSIRDNEVIQAADEHSLAMVFTGVRHFKH
jgi:phosphoribosylaminoimidazolecarboxamide formyltransferase/IMP cyclohydrolase